MVCRSSVATLIVHSIPIMSTSSASNYNPQDGKVISHLRTFADQAFSRTAGAPLVSGNKVRLLRDSTENYPAWLEAIHSAKTRIHFENYIIRADEIGHEFAAALSAKAREGVCVRLIYDWFGSLSGSWHGFWDALRHQGIEVRCFNPPRIDSPFSWLSRDHRKMLSVDSRIAFVTGLCVDKHWAGNPARGIEPWRDTGVGIEGPAVLDVEQAFAAMWATLGAPIPPEEVLAHDPVSEKGEVALRVVPSMPNIAGLYRLDQLVAAIARRSIWLADAYFVGTTPYVEALKSAALDGVDVRLLVPMASDVPGIRAISRSGFRGLLESGVRIFEWNGPMMHAKTAVADGRWSRIGSTNLNLSSWIGNWELDVVAEDEGFSQEMEQMFLNDLTRSTEIILKEKRRVQPASPQPETASRQRAGKGSAGRAATGVIRIGNAVGAAITNHRTLGPAEAKIMFGVACFLLLVTVVIVLWPRILEYPVAAVGAWLAISLLIRAYRLRHRRDE